MVLWRLLEKSPRVNYYKNIFLCEMFSVYNVFYWKFIGRFIEEIVEQIIKIYQFREKN